MALYCPCLLIVSRPLVLLACFPIESKPGDKSDQLDNKELVLAVCILLVSHWRWRHLDLVCASRNGYYYAIGKTTD